MSILFAFPGQGAQQPGMLHRLPEGSQPLIEQADAVLGESILGLDTPEALQSTRAVQLCLLVAGVAWARWLLQRNPPPDFVAGLSIGAYPAAVVVDALDFADAVSLVALRGELMQRAYPHGYGMMALGGMDLEQVEQVLSEVPGKVYVANLNGDQQIVIAGRDTDMARVAQRIHQRGQGTARRLAVSVPSHCALLNEPAARLAEAFAHVSLRRPRITYLSGSTARPVHDPARLAQDLAGNMATRVEWRATLRNAYERGVRLQVELPPGSVLSGLARKILEQGRVVAVEATRPDTVDALMRQEVLQHR